MIRVRRSPTTLTFSCRLDAPPARVFEMFRNPDLLKLWWGRETCRVAELSLDFRPGGEWHTVLAAPAGLIRVRAVYGEIVEGRRIVYTEAFVDEAGRITEELPQGVTTVTLKAFHGGTKLVSRVDYPNVEGVRLAWARGMADGVREGWNLLKGVLMNQVTSKDGTVLAYDKSGSGPALIVVDGAFCHRRMGPSAALAQALSPQFTVYTYDRRGRGDSSDTQPYSVERELEDLQAVMDKAGGRALLLGVSSGAVLSLKAAIAGLGVEGLLLYEPPFRELGYTPLNPDPVGVVQTLVAAGRRGQAVKYFLTKVMGAPGFFAFLLRLMPKVWASNVAVAHTLAYDLTILGDSSVPNAASTLQVPTLVVGGDKSPAMLQSAVKATAAAIPGAQGLLLEGQTHNLQAAVLAPHAVEFFLRQR